MKSSSFHIYYLLLLGLCLSLPLQAQVISKATAKAINNYLNYSNEVVFGVNIMYQDFVQINEQFNNFVEDKADSIVYIKEDVLTNYKYFPVYPRELFNDIYNENINIPYDKRGEPLQLIGKVLSVVDEIERSRSTLAKYVATEAYRQDSVLQKGYKILRRVEVLYYDIFTLQEKLYWSLQTIMSSYKRPVIDSNYLTLITELQPLLSQSKRIIKSVRAKDASKSLGMELAEQQRLLLALKGKQITLLQDIPIDPESIQSAHKRFDKIWQNANTISTAARAYLQAPAYQNLYHDPSHYYYNNQLLSRYNRYGNGMVTVFNNMIKNSSTYWLLEHEMPFLFAVIYPDIPAYAEFNNDSIPDAEEFLKEILAQRAKVDSLEAAKKDSLRLDSLAQVKVEPSLDGYATNNLIFLLDISSSMDTPEKLPLLKEALRYLLDLMREEDNITLITYSTKAEILLPPTSALLKDSILLAIANLKTEGVSNANVGINLAYAIAQKSYIANGNNRIILATDGGFKVQGSTKRKIKQAARSRNSSTFLSVFYFSQKEYNHNKVFLNELANWGKGKYSYIEPENAEETLLEEAQAVRKK